VINCIWSSIVGCFDFNLNVIFSPADPDLFHENFTKTFEFLNKFEVKCSQFDRDFKKRLCDSQSYKYFVKKWPIQVYFQIRFQEIVAKFEEDLQNYSNTVFKNTTDTVNSEDSEQIDEHSNMFDLAISETLIKQMEYCWIESKCFLKCLLSQFWKLNLQLVSRYSNFFIESFQNHVTTDQTQLTSTLQGNETRSKTPIENDLDSVQSNVALKKSPIDDLSFCMLLLNDVNKLASSKVSIF
jgi:conserved oligomeric Golgi complex subunit 2